MLESAPNTAGREHLGGGQAGERGTQLSVPMFDDGANGGDAIAGDGVYTTLINPSARRAKPHGRGLPIRRGAPLGREHGALRHSAGHRRARSAWPGCDRHGARAVGFTRGGEAPHDNRLQQPDARMHGGIPPSPNLCPSQQSTIQGGPITIDPGQTVPNVSVNVSNCPITSSGRDGGRGAGYHREQRAEHLR